MSAYASDNDERNAWERRKRRGLSLSDRVERMVIIVGGVAFTMLMLFIMHPSWFGGSY